MGSLRVLLYLVRDTLHRWLTRISSPLARVMVVFFLSLSGLIFLSSYVISVNALRIRINRSGAGLIVSVEMVHGGIHAPGHALIRHMPGEYTLHIFHESFAPVQIGQTYSALVELPPELSTLLPPGAHNGLLALPEKPVKQRHPIEVKLNDYRLTATTLPEQEAGFLRRLWPSGAVFVPAGSQHSAWSNGFLRKYVLQVQQVDGASVMRWENMLRQLSRLDKRNLNIISSANLLDELSEMESIQYRVRVLVAVGISIIICLLLTAISSLEYRQNRYVYALLGSFGASRPLLFLAFIGENTALVAAGFGGALAALYSALQYMTTTLYRAPELRLSMWELEDDIRTFCLALGICVAVSGVPILAAICRPIGKVLK